MEVFVSKEQWPYDRSFSIISPIDCWYSSSRISEIERFPFLIEFGHTIDTFRRSEWSFYQEDKKMIHRMISTIKDQDSFYLLPDTVIDNKSAFFFFFFFLNVFMCVLFCPEEEEEQNQRVILFQHARFIFYNIPIVRSGEEYRPTHTKKRASRTK